MMIDRLFVTDDELPKALTKEETGLLLKEVASGSQEARDRLITYNIRLVLFEVLHKFQSIDYDQNELLSIGIMGLIKAIDTFDLTKSSGFTSYVTRCIDNEILMFLRKLKKTQKIDSLDRKVYQNKDGKDIKLGDILADDSDFTEDIAEKDNYKLVRGLVEQLPERKREIVKIYYGFYNSQKYTHHEIAEIFHITQGSVTKSIKRTLQQLKEQLMKADAIQTKHNLNMPQKKQTAQKPLSIYEYFNSYPRKQIEQFLEQDISSLALDNLIIMLQAKDENNLAKKVLVKLLELLNRPNLSEMLNGLTVKETIILLLKIGYIDGKTYITKSIAEFLEIEEKEAIIISKRVLTYYKDSLNAFLAKDNKSRTFSIRQ